MPQAYIIIQKGHKLGVRMTSLDKSKTNSDTTSISTRNNLRKIKEKENVIQD